ncbi:BMC domain-containing protein [Clostridium magnum]|uniref:BMC domain protein n=1 Tax=Clostridium magnum DSM 2767 TaxID=1121326 RepID=A0A162S1M9_9CLOT|nr:BMC domain-containing protein [Clostridium magnum]KZL90661.1 BMC domain protein [Clostridium magnum DSM 2767]SHI39002.1 Carboxysome shell and ethanolamine utilization microcompartment protein CcmL/EutN [Clostridium magnum DSM 2767]
MIRTIGLIELNSIARGIQVADEMIKSAEVELLLAKTVCPGKYIILVTGNVGAVQAAISHGEAAGREAVVNKLLVPNVHPQVIPAINAASNVEKLRDLGVLEFFSIASAIVAADAAAKSANVELIEVRLGVGIGGKAFITLTGDISSVNNAVTVGANTALESGLLVNKAVISAPSKELLQSLL